MLVHTHQWVQLDAFSAATVNISALKMVQASVLHLDYTGGAV